MKRNRRSIMGLLLAFAPATGCASYRQMVADDFRDTFKAKVGVGVGLYGDAKVTSFLNPGLGWGGYWANVGLENRHTGLVHRSLNACPFPIGAFPGALPDESVLSSLRMANVRLSQPSDTGAEECAVVGQLFDVAAMRKWDAYGADKRSPHTIFYNREPTYTEQPCGLEVGIGLVFVHLRLGFDPVEFVDLLLTICRLDILNDNGWATPASGESGERNAPRRPAVEQGQEGQCLARR